MTKAMRTFLLDEFIWKWNPAYPNGKGNHFILTWKQNNFREAYQTWPDEIIIKGKTKALIFRRYVDDEVRRFTIYFASENTDFGHFAYFPWVTRV